MNERQHAALQELAQKTLVQIQTETARTWAYRAWAAYAVSNRHDGIEFEHEALEHAALSENDGLLAEVRAIIRGEL